MSLAKIPEIELDQVSMRYASGVSDVLALKEVSLDIRKGEFVSLLGPSGCGKTTLLRIMADLLQPTSGKIKVGGKSVSKTFQHEQSQMISESDYIISHVPSNFLKRYP
ncbi:ATP-binding cassette domain-containing protein [Paenibacillus sp.]|uniref:ATP-binding cassette domain-containing protein n=1 Tax=Paenibacillus TaxID=44249 RepID=UPI003564D0E1